MGDKTNEITAAVPLLRGLIVEGRIFTMDALLTQRPIAQAIVEGGGGDVMVVKGNQPEMLHAIDLVLSEPPEDDDQPGVETIDRGHGRIAYRRLTASSALVSPSDWPGLQQVFRLARTTICRKTDEVRAETVRGVTGLDRAHATVARLLELPRRHWRIENRSHCVRDVTFDEDHSQVRCGVRSRGDGGPAQRGDWSLTGGG